MGFDQVVTTGLVALFGGAVLWAAIGALVGRFQGFEVGIATGMILFGLTGLAFAAWLAWLLWGPGADGAPDRDQIGLVGVFGAFGGFGALGGSVVLASELEKRRPRAAKTPVSRARTGWSVTLIVAANLVLLWGVVVGLVMDDDNLRGAQTMFRSVTVSCACWFVASIVGGTAGLAQSLIYLLVGGGFYLAAASIDLFGREPPDSHSSLSRLRERAGVRVLASLRSPTLTPALSRPAGEGARP